MIFTHYKKLPQYETDDVPDLITGYNAAMDILDRDSDKEPKLEFVNFNTLLNFFGTSSIQTPVNILSLTKTFKACYLYCSGGNHDNDSYDNIMIPVQLNRVKGVDGYGFCFMGQVAYAKNIMHYADMSRNVNFFKLILNVDVDETQPSGLKQTTEVHANSCTMFIDENVQFKVNDLFTDAGARGAILV